VELAVNRAIYGCSAPARQAVLPLADVLTFGRQQVREDMPSHNLAAARTAQDAAEGLFRRPPPPPLRGRRKVLPRMSPNLHHWRGLGWLRPALALCQLLAD